MQSTSRLVRHAFARGSWPTSQPTPSPIFLRCKSSSTRAPKREEPENVKATRVRRALKDHPALALMQRGSFPNLMVSDRALDHKETAVFPPSSDSPYENKVIIRNDTQFFLAEDGSKEGGSMEDAEESQGREEEEGREKIKKIDPGAAEILGADPLMNIPLSSKEIKHGLHRYPLLGRRVTLQTGKGKQHRISIHCLVGNGEGLVGLGSGTNETHTVADARAFKPALRNMDSVERFENRTLWTEMEGKFGATRVVIRPRPIGFGLRCNPWIHQIFKAAGIKDASAKVWGSRNPYQVVTATLRMLHAGNAPLGMGDGIGGKGRRLEKGSGVRSAADIERERGRKLVPLRTF